MLIFNISSFVVLPRGENKLLLSNLLFWLDVTDFDASGKRSGDRYLRLCEAWDIFNKYIAVGKQCQLNWLIYSLNMRFVIDGGGGRRGGGGWGECKWQKLFTEISAATHSSHLHWNEK